MKVIYEGISSVDNNRKFQFNAFFSTFPPNTWETPEFTFPLYLENSLMSQNHRGLKLPLFVSPQLFNIIVEVLKGTM